MKGIVLDSSTIISLANNCLLPLLKWYKNQGVDLVVSEEVVNETVTKALETKRFILNGLKVEKLLTTKIIRTERAETEQLEKLSNNLYSIRNKPIKIMHLGELETLMIAKQNNYLVAVDERNTRLLVEQPLRIKHNLETKIHKKVKTNKQNLNKIKQLLKKIQIIRSAELVAYAFEKNYFNKKPQKLIEGLLWGLKFSGCAITKKEIQKYQEMLTTQ